jgi:hypothetical protein
VVCADQLDPPLVVAITLPALSVAQQSLELVHETAVRLVAVSPDVWLDQPVSALAGGAKMRSAPATRPYVARLSVRRLI